MSHIDFLVDKLSNQMHFMLEIEFLKDLFMDNYGGVSRKKDGKILNYRPGCLMGCIVNYGSFMITMVKLAVAI